MSGLIKTMNTHQTFPLQYKVQPIFPEIVPPETELHVKSCNAALSIITFACRLIQNNVENGLPEIEPANCI